MTVEAAEGLVADYKQLRVRDASGAALSSWRVTVRQLESMIRLSEAVAKLYCSAEVEFQCSKRLRFLKFFKFLNFRLLRITLKRHIGC